MPLPAELRNLKISGQGKAIAEKTADGWLLMLPDGVVTSHRSRKSVEREANVYFERRLKETGTDIGIGTLEWRY